MRPQTSNTGVNNTRFIAAWHWDFEDGYETEYSGSIDSRTPPSIDITIQPPIDNHPGESIDISPVNETFALPEHCYPSSAVSTQTQKSIDYHHGETISRQGDYSFGSWADESHHESFPVDTALPEIQSDEYDEDYHRAKNIEYWYIVFLAHYIYVLLIVFKVLSSLFSSFESLQVWSCIGLEISQLEDKRRKKVWFGVFRAEQSSGAAWVPALAAEIKKGSFQIFRDLP